MGAEFFVNSAFFCIFIFFLRQNRQPLCVCVSFYGGRKTGAQADHPMCSWLIIVDIRSCRNQWRV